MAKKKAEVQSEADIKDYINIEKCSYSSSILLKQKKE